MSPVVCALGAIKIKIMVPWGMWSVERGVRSVEQGVRNAERWGVKIEINAEDLPRAGQCGGVCVYNHGLTGHKHISTVIVFCTWSEFLGCHRHQADVRTNTGYWI